MTLWDDILAAGPQLRLDSDCDYVAEHARREAFRRTYAYAVPSQEAIQRIIAFADGPIVEIGAGRGLWAHLIQLAGGEVRPTDMAVEGRNMLRDNHYAHLREGEAWTHIERMDAVTAAANAPEPTLMTVWPAYEDEWAYRALLAFRGARVVYVGEGYGGCTADDAFHNELGSIWELADEVSIPQWDCLHDSLFLYSRKEAR